MRKVRAFTLTEVMVVLTVLALVAILAYSFMGNIVKEAKASHAATQIIKDIGIFSNAIEEYVRRTGSIPPLVTATDFQNFQSDVLSMGIIKAWPKPDKSWAKTDEAPFSNAYNPSDQGYWIRRWNYSGASSAEAYAFLYYVNEEICQELNKRVSLNHSDGSIPTNKVSKAMSEGGFICSEGSYNYTVVGLLDNI